ncbi:MAG TPA: hypothetical protein VMO75_04000 [Chthoniobacterales bacterium]|nr:hypothetical protein [Chthoniobacterales bacterium]
MEKLKQAIEKAHNCTGNHVESVNVTEMSGVRKVWEGVVEVFDVTNHPEAKRCYAWRYFDGVHVQYVTVLEIPPVNSPQTAVRANIASGKQK